MYRAPDAFLHQVVGGRWRLVEGLGATEHGTVFRVETLENGGPARLELWDQRHVERRGELARFEREARTLSHLRHERVLSVAAFGAHEGLPYLVTELPPGKPLRDELGGGDLTVPRALSLGLQLVEGLRHLHGHGVVHRAVSPENVWVARSASADLLTLGLPRFGQSAGGGDAPGDRVNGFYRPPERAAGRPDHRADLYAAGMLLYVMCTGREPPGELAAANAGGAPLPPPRTVSPERGITEGLERVILRAVAPSPDVRFASADELLAALQAAGARPPSPKRRAELPRQRTAILAAACAGVVVLGAGVLRSAGIHEPSAPTAVQAAPPASAPPAVSVVPPPPPRVVIAAAPVAPKPQLAPPTARATAPTTTAPTTPAPTTTTTAPTTTAPTTTTPAGTTTAPTTTTTVGAARAAPPGHAERAEIWALLDSGHLDEGAARIKSLVAADPDAAWPQFALGVFYYRKYWRRDAVRHWQQALEQDREIRHDPQFGAYLCFMLDDTWKAAGMTQLLNQLGTEAVPLLDQCAASAKTPQLRALASRTLAELPRRPHGPPR